MWAKAVKTVCWGWGWYWPSRIRAISSRREHCSCGGGKVSSALQHPSSWPKARIDIVTGALGCKNTYLQWFQTDQVWTLGTDKIQRQGIKRWWNKKRIHFSEADTGKTHTQISKTTSKVLKLLLGLWGKCGSKVGGRACEQHGQLNHCLGDNLVGSWWHQSGSYRLRGQFLFSSQDALRAGSLAWIKG